LISLNLLRQERASWSLQFRSFESWRFRRKKQHALETDCSGDIQCRTIQSRAARCAVAISRSDIPAATSFNRF